MTTTQVRVDTNRVVSDHVATVMFRVGLNQRGLAREAGMNHATLGRKLKGVGEWTFAEVVRIAEIGGVTVQEMHDGLPALSEWEARRDLYAIRDSNPEPAVLEHLRPNRTCSRADFELVA